MRLRLFGKIFLAVLALVVAGAETQPATVAVTE